MAVKRLLMANQISIKALFMQTPSMTFQQKMQCYGGGTPRTAGGDLSLLETARQVVDAGCGKPATSHEPGSKCEVR